MRVTAKADYAMCAVVSLARSEGHVTAEWLAEESGVPVRFLEKILHELRRAGIVDSRRGVSGGHGLARPAAEISAADVLRAIDGPLLDVHGSAPQALPYPDGLGSLRDLWTAVAGSMADVLEGVTVADLAAGVVPGPARPGTRGGGSRVSP